MNRPSYKELWSDEYKDRDEQLQWIRNAVNGNAKFRNSEPPYSEEEELARKIMQMHARIAELERDKKALRGIEENLREHIDIGTQQLSVATARIAELEAERDQAKAIVSRLRDFLFDYTQFHISTNPEERWWALVDKFDELVKEREE